MTVVLDVWGGELSETHLARLILPIDVALARARAELARGHLVNLRVDYAGVDPAEESFDLRN